jgi:hypothetical protein
MRMYVILFFIALFSTGCMTAKKYGDIVTITYGTMRAFNEVEALALEQCPDSTRPELTGVFEGEMGGNQASFKCTPGTIKKSVKNSGSISNLTEPPSY